ncbi:hypothetical protein ABIE56_000343 [Luteibacter sp. 621]|uniref:hypothetical protein n=1 Tax=Luteibacter sp. 621 TaxID=3373916 RepID=UPI003D259CD7
MGHSDELTHSQFERALDLVVNALAAELHDVGPVNAARARLDKRWDELHPKKNESPTDPEEVTVIEAGRAFLLRLRNKIQNR